MSELERTPRPRTVAIEIVSIVFAVLFALAVDEWWEERENTQLAERTSQAIARELRSNRDELTGSQGTSSAAEMLENVDSALADYRTGDEPDSVGVNWDYALLSASAWETARMTRAAQFMAVDRLVDLAQVYELQRLFSRNQDQLASLIAGIGPRIETEPVRTLSELRAQMATTLGVRETLGTVYACTLVELEGPDVPEADACPDDETAGTTP